MFVFNPHLTKYSSKFIGVQIIAMLYQHWFTLGQEDLNKIQIVHIHIFWSICEYLIYNQFLNILNDGINSPPPICVGC